MAAEVPRASLAGCQADGPAMNFSEIRRVAEEADVPPYNQSVMTPASLSARHPRWPEHRALLLHDRHPGA